MAATGLKKVGKWPTKGWKCKWSQKEKKNTWRKMLLLIS